jgi:hypothetical protein
VPLATDGKRRLSPPSWRVPGDAGPVSAVD